MCVQKEHHFNCIPLVVSTLAAFILLLDQASTNKCVGFSHREHSTSTPLLPPAPWNDAMLYTAGFSESLSVHHAQTGAGGSLDRGYALLTTELQGLLRRTQYPATCTGGRFLVSNGQGPSTGIGSLMQTSAMHLGLAFALNRTFLWGSDVLAEYIDTDTCGGDMNIECFVQAPSSCTLVDAYTNGADTLTVIGSDAQVRHFGLDIDYIPAEAMKLLSGAVGDGPQAVPVGPSSAKYLWRTQAASFLARLNDKTIDSLRILRLQGVNNNFDNVEGAGPGLNAPPLRFFFEARCYPNIIVSPKAWNCLYAYSAW